MTADGSSVVTAKHLGSLVLALMQRLIGAFNLVKLNDIHSTDVQQDFSLWHTQEPLQVQALDFSRWLLQNVRQEDHVYLQMNAAGAEYLILEQLIVDGSILLVDEIDVVWHDDTTRVAWPGVVENLLTKLGLQSSSPGRLYM